MIEYEKICNLCEISKPLSQFYYLPKKDIWTNRCMACTRSNNKKKIYKLKD